MWANSAFYTILSVICTMRIMSATNADTCINALKNIRDLPSGNTSDISAWLAQLVERQSAVREVEGSSPRPDQHSGSYNNWEECAAFVIISANG